MKDIFKIFRLLLFTITLVNLIGIVAVGAQEGLLDGRVFVGQSREKHKRTVKEGELRFMDGAFHSTTYGQKGFNKGVYTARVEEGKVYFEAETMKSKNNKIKWRGVVDGDSIEVKYRWSKKGWLSNTQKDYSFTGLLKK